MTQEWMAALGLLAGEESSQVVLGAAEKACQRPWRREGVSGVEATVSPVGTVAGWLVAPVCSKG